MLFTDAMPRDCFTLPFALSCPQKGHSFNFAADHTDGYMGFFPPGGGLDAITSTRFANATLTIPTPEFHAALANAFPDIPDTVLARGAGMRIGLADQARLRGLLSAVERMLWQPGDALASALARRHIERDLLETFFAALRSGCSELVPEPRPPRGWTAPTAAAGPRLHRRACRRADRPRRSMCRDRPQPLRCGISLSRYARTQPYRLSAAPATAPRPPRLAASRTRVWRGEASRARLWFLAPWSLRRGIPRALRRKPERDAGMPQCFQQRMTQHLSLLS